MALVPSPSTQTQLTQKLDLNSIHSLISIVNLHLNLTISDPIARNSLHRKCCENLSFSNQANSTNFEFSDHSVLSNLYWGIEATESAIQCNSLDERNSRLADSEKMLQVPSMQDEDGTIAGVENRFVVSISYFYLSLVKKLQGDQWQMTMHFLHSVSVYSVLVRTELAPRLFECAFGVRAPGAGRVKREEIDDVARLQARRYKSWLMYYRVVSYGETPPWSKNCDIGTSNYQGEYFAGNTNINSFLQSGSHDEKEIKENNFDIRRLQEMLEESQSDSPSSLYSHADSTDGSDSEDKGLSAKIMPIDTDLLAPKLCESNCLALCRTQDEAMIFAPESPNYISNQFEKGENNEENQNYLLSSRSQGSTHNSQYPFLDYTEVIPTSTPNKCKLRCLSNFSPKFLRYRLPELVSHGSFARRIINFSSSERDWSDGSSNFSKEIQNDLIERFEKAISTLYFSEGQVSADAGSEIITVWDLVNNQKEISKYNRMKQDILDQLLYGISTSQKEKVVRASVYILLLMITEDKSIIQDIKQKDLYLHDLASALKRDIHEAVILFYLLNPSPTDIKTLELLPTLVEVACNSNCDTCPVAFPLTPTSASIALIEIMVTSFDYVTNNIHLAALSSPHVLSKLVNVAMSNHSNADKLDEGVALTAILVRCMRLNGNCKKFLSQVTPVDPFLHLLRRKEKRAKLAALEYFHEILQMPRSSANHLLEQIWQQGGLQILHSLSACIHHQPKLEHRLLAANLLLHLDILGKSSGKSVFKEEAMEVILNSVSSSEENCSMQTLAASILANIGGTHSWSGESYTATWLLKKSGLISATHRNMIRNIDWLDPCLQESETSAWSTRSARAIVKTGVPLFNALAKGMQSKSKSVSRDCLVCVAWLGSCCAAGAGPTSCHVDSACEILLADVARFLHPGSELDERVLACLCIYNYTSGKGKQKLMSFSEGIRESLRRLSSVTWMAEELLRVTDYFHPTKPRVSCVHTQILELCQTGNGAVTAIIFFKGLLFAGYADGTIKAWEISGQRATLVKEMKEHKKTVTCFAVLEPADILLSGSTDKSIRVWSMVENKLECVEIMNMKEPVQKVETFNDKIFIIMQTRSVKLCYASRCVQPICKNKHVKSVATTQGKLYLGCTDSSIQEIDVMGENKIEIRLPDKSWRVRKQPINSLVVYKDWMYCAGSTVEGSSLKDWRKRGGARMSVLSQRGSEVQAMAVVEDFIYLSCTKSSSIIQIWLREKQQKVGRLAAGSKITSLLTANDTIFCGTETGSIKAWIPL